MSIAFQFVENLIIASTYWYFKNKCCHKRKDTIDLTGEAAWFSIAACVFWVSPQVRDQLPESLHFFDGARTLSNAVIVALSAHLLFCFLWIEFLTALSAVFCYLDKFAEHAGFPMLMNNFLLTLKPNCGYLNLFTVLAFILWIVATIFWVNSCEFEDSLDECSCKLMRSIREGNQHAYDALFGHRRDQSCSGDSTDSDSGQHDGRASPDASGYDVERIQERKEPAGPRTRARTRAMTRRGVSGASCQ